MLKSDNLRSPFDILFQELGVEDRNLRARDLQEGAEQMSVQKIDFICLMMTNNLSKASNQNRKTSNNK